MYTYEDPYAPVPLEEFETEQEAIDAACEDDADTIFGIWKNGSDKVLALVWQGRVYKPAGGLTQ